MFNCILKCNVVHMFAKESCVLTSQGCQFSYLFNVLRLKQRKLDLHQPHKADVI